MASVTERLATLENERVQHRKELELFWKQKEARDVEMAALKASVAKVCAWQKRFGDRLSRYGKLALWAVVLLGAQAASEPWQRILGDLSKQFVRSLP